MGQEGDGLGARGRGAGVKRLQGGGDGQEGVGLGGKQGWGCGQDAARGRGWGQGGEGGGGVGPGGKGRGAVVKRQQGGGVRGKRGWGAGPGQAGQGHGALVPAGQWPVCGPQSRGGRSGPSRLPLPDWGRRRWQWGGSRGARPWRSSAASKAISSHPSSVGPPSLPRAWGPGAWQRICRSFLLCVK